MPSAMHAQGIPTAAHNSKALHHHRACAADCCLASNKSGDKVMSQPMSAYLTFDDQDRIIAAPAGLCEMALG